MHSDIAHNTQCVIADDASDDGETTKARLRFVARQLQIEFGAALDSRGRPRLGVRLAIPNERGGEVEEVSEFLEQQLREGRKATKPAPRNAATVATARKVSR